MTKTIRNKINEGLEGKRVKDENGEIYEIKGVRGTPEYFGGVKKIFYTAKYKDRSKSNEPCRSIFERS